MTYTFRILSMKLGLFSRELAMPICVPLWAHDSWQPMISQKMVGVLSGPFKRERNMEEFISVAGDITITATELESVCMKRHLMSPCKGHVSQLPLKTNKRSGFLETFALCHGYCSNSKSRASQQTVACAPHVI